MKTSWAVIGMAGLSGFLGGLLAFLISNPLIAGAEIRAPKFLPASTFALIDQAGRLHGTWTASDNGRTDLVFIGADEKSMVLQIAADRDGTGSITFYKDGKPEFLMTGKGAARFNQPDNP